MILAIILWAAQHMVKTAEIRKLYVSGNNEAAASVRRKIARESCFTLVSKVDLADGTLAVEQAETSGGVNALTSLLGSGSTTVVSAELESKGTVIWQDSKQGIPGIVSTGAVGGASRVLESLYKSVGCDKKGRR